MLKLYGSHMVRMNELNEKWCEYCLQVWPCDAVRMASMAKDAALLIDKITVEHPSFCGTCIRKLKAFLKAYDAEIRSLTVDSLE